MRNEPEPLHLSCAQIKTLECAYKHERDRRFAERIQCILLFAKHYPLPQIKAILCVQIPTLKQWIALFRTHGLDGLRQWGYHGQPAALTDAQWAEVEAELERKCYHRAKEVAVFVKEHFQIEYSERGMQALLRRKGYRHIKCRLLPGKTPSVEVQKAFLQAYFERKATLGPHDRLYFVDAMHPTYNVRLSYAWTKKGLRRRIRSNTGRQRYNILGAYCPLDQEYIDVRSRENVTALTLQQLIDEIRARHPKAEQIILYLDNARYNHARVVSEHIDGTNVELVFLPSYAPNLNLIERLWRFAKDKVMSDTYYETFEQFIAAFDQVLSHLDRYADELATLMTEKFEILACG